MPYQTMPVADIPKKAGRGRVVDEAAATEIYDLLQSDGEAATDGESYPDQKSARGEASKARRLVLHKNAEANVRTRVWNAGTDGEPDYRWSVQLASEAKKKGK